MVVGDTYLFPGFHIPVITKLTFQSHKLLFSHVSEVRGENMPQRKVASTRYRTHNRQVMSQTEPHGRVGYLSLRVLNIS